MHFYNQGFTLIEVLISLVLLSFIVLGFDATALYSLRSTRAAYYLHIATHQLVSITERLRVSGKQNDIDEQISIWNLENKKLLPEGEGSVIGHYPNYTITIHWGNQSSLCNPIQIGQSGCIQQSIKL